MKDDDGFGLASSVIPVLLNVAARLEYGTCTVAAFCKLPPENEAVASSASVPGVSPVDGAVTVNVTEPVDRAATLPSN